MRDLNENQLTTLYFNFIDYRDNICNGRALMSVQCFYDKFGLESWTK